MVHVGRYQQYMWRDTNGTCRRIPAVHVGNTSGTFGKYSGTGGTITAVHVGGKQRYMWGNSFSTVGDSFSTVGDSFSNVGIALVMWGIASVLWRDNISAVEVAQYSGDEDLKYCESLKNLEIFSRDYFASKSDRPYCIPQVLTTADMVKDLGYKLSVLGKILLEPMTD